MNHHPQYDNEHSTTPALVPVCFEFTDPRAHSVCVAGSFNQWQPGEKPLSLNGHGHWWKEAALPPGTYEYCLVVDGEWIADPLAEDYVPNPYGGRNSVMTVSNPSSPIATSETILHS
jgi:1,4-alpha-glucan branching enzyme